MSDTDLEVGLSLGSNLGDRLQNLRDAADRISSLSCISGVERSRVYETDPVDVPAEFDDLSFLNSVLIARCAVEPAELLDLLAGIEDALGRRRGAVKNAPRTIDIDLIYAGDLRIASEDLVIPHPRWHERLFVVLPLHDLRAGLRLPGAGGSVAEILDELPGVSSAVPLA